jgi:hypothetical protein
MPTNVETIVCKLQTLCIRFTGTVKRATKVVRTRDHEWPQILSTPTGGYT